MQPEIKILSQLSIKEIFEVQSSSQSDLKAWIANGYYTITTTLVSSAGNRANEFELTFQQNENLYASLANDCNRFAQAAIESMLSIKKVDELPRSSSWASIKMYYSAFFAAHAILRIFGRACSQLDNNHVSKVLEIAQVSQQNANISNIEHGFYFSEMTGNTIKFKKLKDSHADTWSSFLNLLTCLVDNIETTTGLGTHQEKAVFLLSDIKDALKKIWKL